MDAGTAVANMMEQGQGAAPVGDKTRATADAGGQEGGREVAEEERRREEEQAAENQAREKRLQEEERKAREELKDRKLYGQDMTAIAMGHPEAAQGPGKLMSMGSSSYVVDMVRRTDTDKLEYGQAERCRMCFSCRISILKHTYYCCIS